MAMQFNILPKSVAIIGSFRQQYREVLDDWNTFTNAGLIVTSPKGTPIIESGIEFVRFESDDPLLTDAQVQQVALHRILRADFVYARLSEGYIGRTACYEIGRILSSNRPLYFSDLPRDLPLEVPAAHIATAEELVERFRTEMPRLFLGSLTQVSADLERGLINGKYQDL
jgi:hypothetical protein